MKFNYVLLCVLISFVGSAKSFFEYHSAVNTYKAQDYGAALTQFEALLTEDPDNAELNYNAGKAAYYMQEFSAAASYFAQAVKDTTISPLLALQSWFDLGNTKVKQKKWQEALECYEKVLTYDESHKEAKDMIEKIKKMLEEQDKQQQNQDQNQDQENQQDQNNQSSDNQQEKNQNKQNQSSQDKNSKNNSNETGQSGADEDNSEDTEQGKESQEKKENQKNKPQKSDKNSPNKEQSQDKGQDDDKASDNDAQDGKSGQDDRKKQDLNNKDGKQSGKEKGEKVQSDKSKKDSQENGRDDFENSMPDIQDHERKDTSSDHSASPHQKESNSSKQDTPVSAKAQAARVDPFALHDGIDTESREGKILKLIEERDAQAAQQLLKMNTQTQRKPGEKNW